MEKKLNINDCSKDEQLEYYSVAYFRRELIKHDGRKVKFIRFGVPPEPDCICEIDKESIGIEVTIVYGDEWNARKIYDCQREYEKTNKSEIEHIISNPLNYLIIGDLNNSLIKKSKKTYSFLNNFLIIRNGHPCYFKSNFIKHKDEIELPTEHPFKEIWLICDRNGSSGLIKLFPEKN